jgi:hypothetical protein
MDPKIWGKPLWKFLHIMVYNYTLDKKESYRKFFTNLSDILPCVHCRNFHKEYQAIHKIRLDSKESLVLWLYEFHCAVNDKLRAQGEPIPPNPSFIRINNKYLRIINKK